MKKVKFSGKLNLNKETIAKLNDEQMNAINGGTTGNACVTNVSCQCSYNTACNKTVVHTCKIQDCVNIPSNAC